MLILVGPSASGKTQIVRILREKYGLSNMVTYTTRQMRLGETEGVDYFFLTKEVFEKRISEGFFIEYVVYNGNYYGTSLSQVSSDKVVILEPNGLKHYLEKLPNDVKVAFLRCSREIVRIRMKGRGDALDVIEKRLLLDEKVFNKDVMKLADWVIDTSASNVYANAEEIYQLYKGFIK
jgi:guanylate kinase